MSRFIVADSLLKDNTSNRYLLFTDDVKPHNIIEYIALKTMALYSEKNIPRIDSTGKECTRSNKCLKKIKKLYENEVLSRFKTKNGFSKEEEALISYTIERLSNINLLNKIHNHSCDSDDDKGYARYLLQDDNNPFCFSVYDHKKPINPWYFLAMYPLVNLRLELLDIPNLLPEFVFYLVKWQTSTYLPFISRVFDFLVGIHPGTIYNDLPQKSDLFDYPKATHKIPDNENSDPYKDRLRPVEPRIIHQTLHINTVKSNHPYSYTATAAKMFNLNDSLMKCNSKASNLIISIRKRDAMLYDIEQETKDNTFYHWKTKRPHNGLAMMTASYNPNESNQKIYDTEYSKFEFHNWRSYNGYLESLYDFQQSLQHKDDYGKKQ